MKKMTLYPRFDLDTKAMRIILLVLFVWSFHHPSVAQIFSEQDAIAAAIAHHPLIRSASLQVDKQRALQRTAFNPQQPAVSIETPVDVPPQLEVEQNFQFPLVYTKRGRWLRSQTNTAQAQAEISKNQIVRDVRLRYLEAQIAEASYTFLRTQEDRWNEIARLSERYLENGQIDKAEALMASRYAATAVQARIQAEYEMQNAFANLGVLTGTEIHHIDTLLQQKTWSSNPDTVFYFQQLNAHQIEAGEKEIAYRKMERLPGIMVGFVRSAEPDTDFRNRLKAGITVPLWQGQYTGEIRAAKLSLEQTELQNEWMQQQASALQTNYLQILKSTSAMLEWFVTTGIPRMEEESQVALRLVEGGEMDMNWYLRSVAESSAVYTKYLDVLLQHNEAAIELSFLTTP